MAKQKLPRLARLCARIIQSVNGLTGAATRIVIYRQTWAVKAKLSQGEQLGQQFVEASKTYRILSESWLNTNTT